MQDAFPEIADQIKEQISQAETQLAQLGYFQGCYRVGRVQYNPQIFYRPSGAKLKRYTATL